MSRRTYWRAQARERRIFEYVRWAISTLHRPHGREIYGRNVLRWWPQYHRSLSKLVETTHSGGAPQGGPAPE